MWFEGEIATAVAEVNGTVQHLKLDKISVNFCNILTFTCKTKVMAFLSNYQKVLFLTSRNT